MKEIQDNQKAAPADYDGRYRKKDYFKYNGTRWKFYRPFLKAVVRKARLKQGASVLDAGCGQGFFTGLFAELGFHSLGVDVSSEGIKSAREAFAETGARFDVGDVMSQSYEEEFDCVFVRGCPAYNTVEFANAVDSTERFLSFLKRGGVLIFDHHTNFCARKHSKYWIHHSLAAVRTHFGRYSNSAVYFSSRADTAVLGALAFNPVITYWSALLTRLVGRGGEAVAFVWKK